MDQRVLLVKLLLCSPAPAVPLHRLIDFLKYRLGVHFIPLINLQNNVPCQRFIVCIVGIAVYNFKNGHAGKFFTVRSRALVDSFAAQKSNKSSVLEQGLAGFFFFVHYPSSPFLNSSAKA